ncbi:MAG: DNA glycosylase [Methanoregula sp.]|jgi:N-glycosylase/DNA lyase|uniref:DNA-3-methyladenine glycosylase family protein n=1 Tax=Methanoregula sp. TaxID=2052170 RepID=UPI003D0A3BFB
MPVLTLSRDQPFSLDQTLACGQVFRWDRTDDGAWYGIVGSHVIRIRQDGPHLSFAGTTGEFIRDYFSLDLDLGSILSAIDRDPFIHTAIERCRGLRLIRQPPWECLISYICSTNSNIPMIRRRIATIAEKFGKEVAFEDRVYYTFPEPDALSCSGDNALADCRLGYRQPYVFRTACDIDDVKSWETSIAAMPCEDARRALMKLSGVGPKAADCILLFAFRKYEAFPVDVWIRRIMQKHYLPTLSTGSALTGWEYDIIRRFARDHFGEYCGYAQEYLYAAREG